MCTHAGRPVRAVDQLPFVLGVVPGLGRGHRRERADGVAGGAVHGLDHEPFELAGVFGGDRHRHRLAGTHGVPV